MNTMGTQYRIHSCSSFSLRDFGCSQIDLLLLDASSSTNIIVASNFYNRISNRKKLRGTPLYCSKVNASNKDDKYAQILSISLESFSTEVGICIRYVFFVCFSYSISHQYNGRLSRKSFRELRQLHFGDVSVHVS